MKKVSISIVFILIFLISGFANANLLSNFDFEELDKREGNISGNRLDQLGITLKSWDVYDILPGGWYKENGAGIEVQHNTVVNAYSGDHYIELDSHPSTNSYSDMWQGFTALTTMEHFVSFWYRPRTNTSSDNGINIYLRDPGSDVGSVDGINSEITEWTYYLFSLGTLSAGVSYDIGFRAVGAENTYGGFLDDITVSSIPEPANMLLLGTGLLGLVGLGRKKIFKK